MPNINLHKHKEDISMIETVCNKFTGVTNREVENTIQSRTVKRRIGHPTDERFK